MGSVLCWLGARCVRALLPNKPLQLTSSRFAPTACGTMPAVQAVALLAAGSRWQLNGRSVRRLAMPRVHVEEEIYTHEYLWRSSTALAELLDADEHAHHHLIIPALVITVMAFEAFVNFCGFALLPERWANEREEFRGQGVDGKLDAIAEKIPKFEFRKGEEPYQSIRQLFAFRDLVAHGKVHANRYETHYQEDGSHFRWGHPWDSYFSRRAVAKTRSDVRSFAQGLVVAMRDDPDHHLHLLHDAFEGALASGEGHGAA